MKGLKQIFAIFLASFIGIMVNPEMLVASDSVKITGVAGAVETVIVKPATSVPKAAETVTLPQTGVALNTPIITPAITPTVAAPVKTEAIPAQNIQIGGKTLEIVDVDSTEGDAGTHVNRYGEKFMWGHNSAAVFRTLYDLGKGDTFTVTLGETTTYTVKNIVIYDYDKAHEKLTLNGAGNYGNFIYDARESKSVGHDLALMTCYGAGNSQRMVVFADAAS